MPSCIPSFLAAHWGVILSVAGYVVLTMARHLPTPGQKMSAYEYFYGVLQSLLAAPPVKAFEAKYASVDTPVVNKP